MVVFQSRVDILNGCASVYALKELAAWYLEQMGNVSNAFNVQIKICLVKNELMTKLDNSKTFTSNCPFSLSFSPKGFSSSPGHGYALAIHFIHTLTHTHKHTHTILTFIFLVLFLTKYIFSLLSLCFNNLKRQYDPTPDLIFKRKSQIPAMKSLLLKPETIHFESHGAFFLCFWSIARAINTDTCDWTC